MEINSIISRWLNGEDFSGKTLSYENYNQLIVRLSDVCGKKINSIEEAYRYYYRDTLIEYKKEINVEKKSLESKSKFLKPLFELKDYVDRSFSTDEILGFFVHGSLATGDFVENYSDFDTLVIVRKEVLENTKRLSDFRKRLIKSNTFLYLLDPLQHHSHFIITEYALLFYPEIIFPLELFKYSTELSSFSNNLEFNVISKVTSKKYLLESLKTRKKFFKEIWPNKIRKGKFNSYDAKNAIQNILLLPALYIEIRDDRYYYKKYTFSSIQKDFSHLQWDLIERASNVRQVCKFKSFYPYWFRKFLGLKINPKLLKKLHSCCDRDITDCVWKIMGKDFLNESVKLIDDIQFKLNE